MIPRPLSMLPTFLLPLLLIYTPVVFADDEVTFDCRPTVDNLKYNLIQLAGEHTINKTREAPPSTMVDVLRFNLCEDLKIVDGVPTVDQCKSGTRACLTILNQKPDEKDRIFSVIPLVNSSSLHPTYKTGGESSSRFLSVLFEGPEYPHYSNSTYVAQSLELTLYCVADENESELEFKSYDGAKAKVEWHTKKACPVEDNNNDDKGGSPTGGDNDGEKDSEKDGSSVGSGIGWFFLMLLLAFATYFALGAYYNYSTYGASGADLIPHRDFWKEVPYMLSDVVSHLCSSVRPRRSSNRGGYIAV